MAKSHLRDQHCLPCEGGVPPLPPAESNKHLKTLRGWTYTTGKKGIQLELQMKDFDAAIQLINRIAKVANMEDHHPDLHITGYRKLRIELSTHSIGGLSVNDFILASKIQALPKKLK